MRRQVSITVTVFMAMMAIALALAAALIAYSYHKNTQIALLAAEKLMREVSDEILERTDALLRPLSSFTRLAIELPDIARKPSFLNHPAEQLIKEFLTSSPQIASVYLGYDDGDFFQVYSLSEHHPATRVVLQASASAALATRLIFQREDGRRVEVWKFLGADRRIVGSRVNREATFDPRERRWYEQAIVSDRPVRLDPYLFATTKQVGLTVARRFDGPIPGVIGVDMTLRSLSEFLDQQELGEQATMLVFRDDGTVLAHSAAAPLVVEPATATDVRHLARIEELGDPVAAALIAAYNEGPADGAFARVFEVEGRAYVGRVEPMPAGFGTKDRLAMLVPVASFVGPIVAIGRHSVWVSIAILIIGLPLIWLLSRRISDPLHKLAGEAERIRQFQLDDPLEITSRIIEVDQLATSMARMKSGLRTFGRYVPKALVRQLIEADAEPSLGGTRREITLLFTDVAGFTDLSETMEPEGLMRRLSAYFEELTQVLMANGATIDKFMGDAIMAFWNAPLTEAGHVARACRGALSARASNAELNRRWAADGLPPMVTRFGLHVGDAVVGNVGSSDRMNYTAMGASVNLASRLEGLNRHYGTEILVSEAVAKRVRDRFLMRSVDKVVPKGIIHPIRIYELLGMVEDMEDETERVRCGRWEDAYAAYLKREWELALEGFRSLAAEDPKDDLAGIYVGRTERYLIDPPGPDWQGVETYLSK